MNDVNDNLKNNFEFNKDYKKSNTNKYIIGGLVSIVGISIIAGVIGNTYSTDTSQNPNGCYVCNNENNAKKVWGNYESNNSCVLQDYYTEHDCIDIESKDSEIEDLGVFDKKGIIPLSDNNNSNLHGEIVWKSKQSTTAGNYVLDIYVRVWKNDDDPSPMAGPYAGKITVDNKDYEFSFNEIILNKKTVKVIKDVNINKEETVISSKIISNSSNESTPKINLSGNKKIKLKKEGMISVNVNFDENTKSCNYNPDIGETGCLVTTPPSNGSSNWLCPFETHEPNKEIKVHCDEDNKCNISCVSENKLPENNVKVNVSFNDKKESCLYNPQNGETSCKITTPTIAEIDKWKCTSGVYGLGKESEFNCDKDKRICDIKCDGKKSDNITVNVNFDSKKETCVYDKSVGEVNCKITIPEYNNIETWYCPHGDHKPGEQVSVHCDDNLKTCDIKCSKENSENTSNVNVNVFFDDKKETCTYDSNSNKKSCQVTIPEYNNVETWYCPYGPHKPGEKVTVFCDKAEKECKIECNSKNDITNQYNIEYKNCTVTGNKSTAKLDEEFEVKNPTKNVSFELNSNGTGANIGSFANSFDLKFKGWTGEKIDTDIALVDGNKWTDQSKFVLGTKFKSLTNRSGSTVYLIANWENETINLPKIEKKDYSCYFNSSKDGSGTKYESNGEYNITNDSPNIINLYAVCKENSKTDDEITDNEKTGTLLITVVWLIGLGTLGYTIYYLKKNKVNM